MSNNRPWDFDQAREACRVATKAQAAAEDQVRKAAADLAAAEERYRVALALRIAVLREAGTAASLCADLARGTPEVAKLKRDRDVASGIYEAMQHAAWRFNADRKDCQRFADWSQRRELAELAGQGTEQPEWATP